MRRLLQTIPLLPSLLVLLLVLGGPTAAIAGETSHYSPGVPNIRDFQLGYKSGFWGTMHNFYYQSGRLNDEHGNETNLIVVRPGSGVFSSIDPDIDVYAMTLSLTWVKKEFLDIRNLSIGAVVAPTLANSSVASSVSAETGQARDPITDQFGFGDLYIQPIWVGWTEPGVFSASASWGFYAPTGEYDTEYATDPSGNSIRVPKLDNIGLGFWTSQLRGAVEYYPTGDDGPTIAAALTHEINSEKENLHITPGQHLTLNWGVSKILPLGVMLGLENLSPAWRLDFGAMGYSAWQVTTDDGLNHYDHGRDQVHAVGAEIGLTQIPEFDPKTKKYTWGIQFHYLNELDSELRLQGHVVSLNLAIFLGGEEATAQAL